MGIIALLDRSGGSAGFDNFALDRAIVPIENFDPVAADHRPIAFVEIGDALRPRRDRERIRAEVILALAVADRQRRASPGADDQLRMIAEQEGDCESSDEARNTAPTAPAGGGAAPRSISRATRWPTTSVSVSLSNSAPLRDQLVAKRFEILDDFVVDQRDRGRRCGGARCRGGRRAMSCPARVRDPGGPRPSGWAFSWRFEIVEAFLLARRRFGVGPYVDRAVDSRGIIAAVLEPLEPIEQPLRDVALADDFDNSCNIFA